MSLTLFNIPIDEKDVNKRNFSVGKYVLRITPGGISTYDKIRGFLFLEWKKMANWNHDTYLKSPSWEDLLSYVLKNSENYTPYFDCKVENGGKSIRGFCHLPQY